MSRSERINKDLRRRAIMRENEVARAWAILEHYGFPADMIGFPPNRNKRGNLPMAIRRAMTLMLKQRTLLMKQRDVARKATAKIEARFMLEKRYDRFGELRSIVRYAGHVMLRRPGRPMCVATEREWDAMARETKTN